MSERRRAARRRPAAGARSDGLQPGGRSIDDLGKPLWLNDALDGISTEDSDQVRRIEDNLARRQADQRVVDALRRYNFDGHHYRLFENELARYGLSILRGWMYSGTVFRLLADRGFNITPSENELTELRNSSETREDLASFTVSKAMPHFRQKALIEGGWTFEGGASLSTYFGGSLLYVFPNEYRAWRAQRKRLQGKDDDPRHVVNAPDRGSVTDPAVLVTGAAWVASRMSALSKRDREIVQLRLKGYSHAEIAEIARTTERAAEGVLYRWRQAEIKEISTREEG